MVGRRAEHSDGWPHSIPGWRVAHFAVSDARVSATESHILLQSPEAVPLVIDVVKSCADAVDVAQNGTACLRQLTAVLDGAAADENRRRACEYGGVELLLSLMERHTMVIQIQVNACQCLVRQKRVRNPRIEALFDFGEHYLWQEAYFPMSKNGKEALQAVIKGS